MVSHEHQISVLLSSLTVRALVSDLILPFPSQISLQLYLNDFLLFLPNRPLWLSPLQVVVIPVGTEQEEYARQVSWWQGEEQRQEQ